MDFCENRKPRALALTAVECQGISSCRLPTSRSNYLHASTRLVPAISHRPKASTLALWPSLGLRDPAAPPTLDARLSRQQPPTHRRHRCASVPRAPPTDVEPTSRVAACRRLPTLRPSQRRGFPHSVRAALARRLQRHAPHARSAKWSRRPRRRRRSHSPQPLRSR